MSHHASAASPPAPAVPPGGSAPPKKKAGLWSRVGTLFLSLVFVVILPIFPIAVECFKNDGSVSSQSFLLTAAVMAAGFAVSTDDKLFQAAYALIFLASVAYDFKSSEIVLYDGSSITSDNLQGLGIAVLGLIFQNFCILVACLTVFIQVLQRVIWHLILDRKFPDWAKE